MKDEDVDLSEIPEITPGMFKNGVRNKYHDALKDGYEVVSRGPGRPALSADQDGDSPITSVRFPPVLLAKVRMAALEEGVTVGDIIRRAVEHELDHPPLDGTRDHVG